MQTSHQGSANEGSLRLLRHCPALEVEVLVGEEGVEEGEVVEQEQSRYRRLVETAGILEEVEGAELEG